MNSTTVDVNTARSNKQQVPDISFTPVPISFAVGVILLTMLVIVGCVSAIGYFNFKSHIDQMESVVQQRGQELTLAAAAASREAMITRNYETLTRYFGVLVEEEELPDTRKSIHEIFLLDKAGRVLAHSDLAEVSINSRDPVSEVKPEYNNEKFHTALELNPGQVFRQKYPYHTSDVRHRASETVKWLLPEKIDHSTDFSTPIERKGSNVATLHVVLTRNHMYYFLSQSGNEILILLAISAGAGLLTGGILILAFGIRASHMQKLWRNLLMLPRNDNQLKEVLDKLSHKVELLETVGGKADSTKNSTDKKEVMDAILIE